MTIPLVDLKTQYQALKLEIDPAVLAVLERGDFILGKAVTDFETAFASFCAVRHAIGVASGLDALTLSLAAYGIGPGDEVITAANTFVATTLAVTRLGARPVLVDCVPDTYAIDTTQIEQVITPRTKAIIPVHLYGQPADMDQVCSIAARHGLRVIEDACQAHGSRYRDIRVGGLGDTGCFSFYPGKNLGAYGDGGMITTNDDTIAERLRTLRNYGSRVKYHHQEKGWNSRLDTVQAAILAVKLHHLEHWNTARAAHAQAYSEALKGCQQITLPVIGAGRTHVFHLYVIRLAERDRVLAHLHARGIGAGIHYPVPIHLLDCHRDLGYTAGSFPVTERAAAQILSLPLYPELTAEQIAQVVSVLRESLTVETNRTVRS